MAYKPTIRDVCFGKRVMAGVCTSAILDQIIQVHYHKYPSDHHDHHAVKRGTLLVRSWFFIDQKIFQMSLAHTFQETCLKHILCYNYYYMLY